VSVASISSMHPWALVGSSMELFAGWEGGRPDECKEALAAVAEWPLTQPRTWQTCEALRLEAGRLVTVRGEVVEFSEAQRRFLVEIDLSGVQGSLPTGAGLSGSLNLKLVRLPSALVEIPGRFFWNRVRLSQVNLGECDHLGAIGSFAFRGCLKLRNVSISPCCRHVGLGMSAVLGLDLRGGAPQVVEVTDCAWLEKLNLPAGGVGELRCDFCPRLRCMSLGWVAPRGEGVWAMTIRLSEVRYPSRRTAGGDDGVSACAFLRASVFGEVTALGRRETRPALAP
jgi:hypothetical protein